MAIESVALGAAITIDKKPTALVQLSHEFLCRHMRSGETRRRDRHFFDRCLFRFNSHGICAARDFRARCRRTLS